MKLLTMQFPPISRHIIPLRSKYSPQQPVLKHSQSVFLPLMLKTKFRTQRFNPADTKVHFWKLWPFQAICIVCLGHPVAI
jgi:hypothetical protein